MLENPQVHHEAFFPGEFNRIFDSDLDRMYRRITRDFVTLPMPSILREFYLNFLRTIVVSPDIFGRPTDQLDEVRGVLEEVLLECGLSMSEEIAALHDSPDTFVIAPPTEKYLTYDGAGGFAREQNKIALVHGAFDPPHFQHCRLIARLFEESGVKVLVGFDNPQMLKERKGSETDPRPRIKYFAGRMWELASLPFVSGVFVLPIASDFSSQDFADMYRNLNVGYLGCGESNPLRSEYETRMSELGGRVIINPESDISSTYFSRLMRHPHFDRIEGLTPHIKTTYKEIDRIARKNGYLSDYPPDF